MRRDRTEETLDLRQAFRPMPESVHAALMQTVRSVEEEVPVKRVTYRTLLIAACIVVVTMAAAVAASGVFGWNDFFDAFYADTKVPKAAQDILEATEEKVFEIGPVSVHVQQLYADRHTAMANAKITMTDGSDALLCMTGSQFDPIGANGENGAQYAECIGVGQEMTWMEVAQKLGWPLYTVEAILDLPAEYNGGEEMQDVLYDSEGNFIDFSMAMLDSEKIGEVLPASMFLYVAEIDPATGEKKSTLSDRADMEIAVAKVTDSVTYTIPETFTVDGITLTSARAELTPAGIYLYTDFMAEAGNTLEHFYETQRTPVWYDESGRSYPWGLNLSYEINTDAWPEIHMMGMISAEEIPDVLVMRLQDDNAAESQESIPSVTLRK